MGEALSNSHLFLFGQPTPTTPPSPPPKHGPLPRPAWVPAKPHRNAAGHMRCGGGGRASPPAPQGDPAPSCPDAVTKVTGEIAPPRPHQRPRVSQRPSQGPHLAQGEEQKVGEEPGDFLRHCFGGVHRRRGDDHHRRHFSLSAFATASPDDSGPTRCCSMRSSPANPYAPDGSHRTPIGCRRRLCLSPLHSRSTQGRAAGQEDGNRHFGERPPHPPLRSQIRDRCVTLVGEPCCTPWPPLFGSRNQLCPSLV